MTFNMTENSLALRAAQREGNTEEIERLRREASDARIIRENERKAAQKTSQPTAHQLEVGRLKRMNRSQAREIRKLKQRIAELESCQTPPLSTINH